MRYWLIGSVIFFVYLGLYLYVSGFIIAGSDLKGLVVLPHWQDLIFKQRSPFLFESIGAWYFAPYFTLLFSVPNFILGLVLSFLVAANMVISFYSFRSLGLKGGRGLLNLIGTIPALLSGMACCAPLLILILGIQLSATLLSAFALLVPLAIILLVGSLWLALRRMRSRQF